MRISLSAPDFDRFLAEAGAPPESPSGSDVCALLLPDADMLYARVLSLYSVELYSLATL